jgi:asparagine synthase (glutamine-hydrolysing)
MCGIWAWLYTKGYKVLDKDWIQENCIKYIEARGPEGTRIHEVKTEGNLEATLGFTRLAINGLHEGGMQPFDTDKATWICNGEIYNSKQLADRMKYTNQSGSDCEVLGEYYRYCDDNVSKFCQGLDGVFSIVLYDKEKDRFIIARDPYGVRPLFYMRTYNGERDGSTYVFASERKALEKLAEKSELTLPCFSPPKIYEFPPGEVWILDGSIGYVTRPWDMKYHTIPWLKHLVTDGWATMLREGLLKAVHKRLMTERPVAALLSGGVDSSLIAAIVQRELKRLGKPALKTFSIGMAGSTDLKYARKVAEFIGSDHTEVLTTADEMFSVIPEVIRDIESYDITTVRASVGNWMVAREIRRQTDCKVVFNGDGSDEIFGSYLYFKRAPTDEAFEEETERLLQNISKYDVLRSDRSISSHGLEARTPFLDKQFVGIAKAMATDLRRPSEASGSQPMGRMEKWALRTAFSTMNLLPEEVLWRRKEAFSDGVSCEEKSWYQEIQERIEAKGLVPDNWSELAEKNFRWGATGIAFPKTKEAFYYRSLYESLYKHTGDYWDFWMPRWSPETNDPSARTLGK